MKKKEFKKDAYIKSALRRIWRWSPARRACLKILYCTTCSVRRKKLYADHVSPVVNPQTGFTTWDEYIERLFNGSLQPLCKECHKAKSKEENAERRKWRKLK